MKSWFLKLILVNFITFVFIFYLYETMYEIVTIPKSIFWIFILSRSLSLIIISYIIIYLVEITRSHDSLIIFLIAGSMYTLAYILETISFIYLNTKIEHYKVFSKNIFILSQTLLTISPILLMYFIASYFTKRPSFLIFLPVILEAIMEIIFQPLDLTLGKSIYFIDGKVIYYWIYQPKIIEISILYFASILWLVSYLITLVLRSKRDTDDKNLRLQQKIFLWGIILVFILSPVLFTIGLFISDQLLKFIWIAIISRTSVNIGLSFFIITYIKSNDKFDFFQSQPMYGLYLMNMQKKRYYTINYFVVI